MSIVNQITLEAITTAGLKRPDSGRSVQVYEYHASDTAGQPPNGSLIGSASEHNGSGIYLISLGQTKKCTVTVDGICQEEFIGVMLLGDTIMDGSVTLDSIPDGLITPAKTTFVEDYS
jgi:hypothetical protein